VAGSVIVACGSGAGEYMQNQLYNLVREFNGSAIAMGWALTIYHLTGDIALLAVGPLIDRFGPRKLMLIGIPLAGAGFLCLGFVSNMLTLNTVLGVLLGIGMSAGFLLPTQTAAANWFIKRRSVALAIVCAAFLLGESILTISEEWIKNTFDRQDMFLGLGVAMLVICIPLTFIIRHRPEQHGYLPDGKSPVVEGENAAENDYTLWQALRTRTFWLLTVAAALASATGVLATVYRLPFLIETGFTQDAIIDVFNIAPAMGLAGILLFGYLGDRFPKRYLLAIAIVLQSASIIVLMTAGNIVQLYLYTLVYGMGSGTIPLILAIRADYFGRRYFATITVVMMFVSTLISSPLSVPWPILAAWILDITGSFQLVFIISMLLGFIPAIIFFYARPPKPINKESPLSES
jgi:MFS family permease